MKLSKEFKRDLQYHWAGFSGGAIGTICGFAVSAILLMLFTGCTSKVTVPLTSEDEHYYCMVMCESTRDVYNNTKFRAIRDRVEKYCYAECNEKYLKKGCK